LEQNKSYILDIYTEKKRLDFSIFVLNSRPSELLLKSRKRALG